MSVKKLLAFLRACLALGWCCAVTLPSFAAPMLDEFEASESTKPKAIKSAPSIPKYRRTPAPPKAVDIATLTTTQVWLYASLSSQAHLMKLGADPTTGTRIWENYLRSQKIEFARVTSDTDIDRIPSAGLLILASIAILSDAEKQAITQWRNRGGAILSTLQTGTYSESGELVGDGFMREMLDVQLAGDTQAEPDDTFLIVHGNSPVSHSLPAGTRLWVPRVPNQLPLRLVGQHDAAQVMNWSRAKVATLPSSGITYNERQMPSGQYSRTVTLGYSENTWLQSDPKLLGALTKDIFEWLQRKPSAYLGAWPHPYQSGFLLALQAGELLSDLEVEIAKTISSHKARATFYVHGGNAAKAVANIKKLQAMGHEIAYFGDSFEGFRGQPEATQDKRLADMQSQLAQARIAMPSPAGFAAPIDAYDALTQRLVISKKFDTFLSFSETTDASLPFIASRTPDGWGETVVLPRTLVGPEDGLDDGDPDESVDNFLSALDISVRSGSLSVVRLPSQTILTPDQRKRIFEKIAALRPHMWMASASQIAQWWRNREKVSVTLTPQAQAQDFLLTVTAERTLKLQESFSIWINLPTPNSRVRLVALQKSQKLPQVIEVDQWRAAVVVGAPPAGKQEWLLRFEEIAPKKTSGSFTPTA